MKIDIITIFPHLFDSFLNESLIARGQKKKLLNIKAHDLRKWTKDNHKTVDNHPYGGGAGMVLMVQPIRDAVTSLKLKINNQKLKIKKPTTYNLQPTTCIISMSAKGKTFTQKDASRFAKYDQLIFICGRYEGIDERVNKYIADEEVSIGNYVLFGGEVPAMVLIEAVSRLISGVVAKEESILNESFSINKDYLSSNLQPKPYNLVKEHPHYTRPEIIDIEGHKRRVPKVLKSGDHAKIKIWRNKQSVYKKS